MQTGCDSMQYVCPKCGKKIDVMIKVKGVICKCGTEMNQSQ